MQEVTIIICPACGAKLTNRIVVCRNCGHKLRNPEQTRTAIVPRPDTAPLPNETGSLGGTAQFNEGNLLYLSIERVNSPITRYVRKRPIILGRQETGGLTREDVDLHPYRGRERGVSRRHARIYARDGELYIEDLRSSNGTQLNGEPLEPLQPYQLHDGDELILGRMMVWVNF